MPFPDVSSIDHAGDWALDRLEDAGRVFPAPIAHERALNGEAMQDESAKGMIVDVARIVAHRSTDAAPMPGDVMDSTITGLGAQRNECAAGR